MFKAGDYINNCYLLQELIKNDSFYETWRAKALYSAQNFLITFFKFSSEYIPKATFKEFHDVFIKLNSYQIPFIHYPFEFDTHQDVHYIASPWIDGMPLNEVIEENKLETLNQVIDITMSILKALSKLEEIDLHHNCLSPQSVILSNGVTPFDILHIQNVGFSIFKNEMDKFCPAEKENAAPHSQDLIAVGKLIESMLEVLPKKEQDQEKLEKILLFSNELQQKPESFTSVSDVYDHLLEIHPEKKSIDLIQEHIFSPDIEKVTHAGTFDLRRYQEEQFAEAKYEFTRSNSLDLEHRQKFYEERLNYKIHELEKHDTPQEASQDTLLELEELEVVEESDGLLKKGLRVIKNLFNQVFSSPKKKPLQHFLRPKKGAPQSHRIFRFFHSGETQDPRKVEETINKMKDHFNGWSKERASTEDLNLDNSNVEKNEEFFKEQSKKKSVLQNNFFVSRNKKYRISSDYNQEMTDDFQNKVNGDTGQKKTNYTRQDIPDREREKNPNYDFQYGPDYSPSERMGLDSDEGPLQEIDFNESSIRGDRRDMKISEEKNKTNSFDNQNKASKRTRELHAHEKKAQESISDSMKSKEKKVESLERSPYEAAENLKKKAPTKKSPDRTKDSMKAQSKNSSEGRSKPLSLFQRFVVWVKKNISWLSSKF